MRLFDFFNPKKKGNKNENSIQGEIKSSEHGIPYIEQNLSGLLSFEDLTKNAVSYFTMGQYRDALESINKAIANNNNNADAYHIRGSIQLSLNNLHEACVDWQKCNELGGDATDLIRKHCSK